MFLFSLRLHQHTLESLKMSTFSIILFLLILSFLLLPFSAIHEFFYSFRLFFQVSRQLVSRNFHPMIRIVPLNYHMQCFCFPLLVFLSFLDSGINFIQRKISCIDWDTRYLFLYNFTLAWRFQCVCKRGAKDV